MEENSILLDKYQIIYFYQVIYLYQIIYLYYLGIFLNDYNKPESTRRLGILTFFAHRSK